MRIYKIHIINLNLIITNITLMDEEEFRQSFDLFDKEEKGYLDRETSKELFNSFGLIISDNELDNIGDKMTYDIFLNNIKQKMKNSKEDNIEKYFEGLISKKTGNLPIKKFKKLLMNFGLKFSEKETNDLLSEFRVDEDGNVNWKEFCRAMK